MADQNVLNGDLTVLGQIMSDLNEHKVKKEELERLNDNIKDLYKSIESLEKSISDEIDSKVKDGIASVSQGYDKSISEEKAKLKDIQNKRAKAKVAGVKERISRETSELKAVNDNLNAQIKDAFKEERIPKYCTNKWFYAMFQTQGFTDVCLYLFSFIVLYLAIPGVLYIIPQIPNYVIIIYCFVIALIEFTVMKIVYNKTIALHSDTITKARRVKYDIITNQKKIKRIEKGIRKDKSEDMYELSDFDYRMNDVNDSIRNIEDQKEAAINDFNATTKTDIIAEVHGRNDEALQNMKSQLNTFELERQKLDSLIKEQRAFISSNYEAYLGKEFMNPEKLAELETIMESNESATISMAIAQYKNKN